MNIMQKRNLLSTIALCAAIFSANAKVIYVTPDGSNANDGTTWEKSVADIQNAYKIAVSGDEIWVAEGVYDLSRLTPVESPVCMVEMKDNVDLYGGFKKGDTSIEARELVNENEPWNFKNLTVITASSDLSVRPFDRADKAVTSTWRSTIDGVKFEGIKTSNARVLYLNNGTTVNNVWMDGCRADGNNSTFLYLERGGVITNSLFENNLKAANAVAGVVQLRGSQAEEAGLIMDNCVFRNNDCTSLSVYVTAGNLKEDRSNDIIVTNTKFLNNNALSLNLNNGMGDYTGRVALVDNCYFEGNECVSDASSNYDGSLAIISGVQSYLNRATIINNKNTAAEDADYKNSLIFVNNGVVSNSLIANNESAHASVSVVGTLVNSTIANNTGFVQLDKTGILFNTVVNNNADDKVKMINESTCILVASAFTNGALEGAADLEEGTVRSEEHTSELQ